MRRKPAMSSLASIELRYGLGPLVRYFARPGKSQKMVLAEHVRTISLCDSLRTYHAIPHDVIPFETAHFLGVRKCNY